MANTKKANVGQIVVAKAANYHNLKTGERAKVIDADRWGDGRYVTVETIEGDRFTQIIKHKDYTIEAVTKFNEGDRVKIDHHIYSGLGTVVKFDGITSTGSEGYLIDTDGESLANREDGYLWFLGHLMEAAPEETKGDEEMTTVNGIAVGDKVVLVANSEEVSLEIGKVYEVEKVDVDCDEGLPFYIGGRWVSADDVEKPKFVKLLEDDWLDGFFHGDVLPLTGDGDEFIDNDGDERALAGLDFEYVASPNVAQADRQAVIEYLTDLDDTELLNMVEDIRASRKEVR